MGRYVTRQQYVDAQKYEDNESFVKFPVASTYEFHFRPRHIEIEDTEGGETLYLYPGDWLVKAGRKLSVMSDEEFKVHYDPNVIIDTNKVAGGQTTPDSGPYLVNETYGDSYDDYSFYE